MTCRVFVRFATAVLLPLSLSLCLHARAETQEPAAKPPAAAPAPSARAMAPFDLTGTWVSVVTEDWRYRMVPPVKETDVTLGLKPAQPNGELQMLVGVPLNAAGKAATLAWTPAEAGRCEAFGIGSGMRAPGLLRIAWESDSVLRIEIEAGQQTRRIHFDPSKPPAGPPSWQGASVGNWDVSPNVIDVLRPGGFDTRNANPGAAQSTAVSSLPWTPLKVVTTNFRAGWLRPNGVPYSDSAHARITEHFMRYSLPGAGEGLTVRTVVDDPTYLEQPFMVSTNFRLEANAARWKPEPCRE